ncbi:MAG: hypothetical protein RL368_165 [Pseudomonadota bacterium]|jgi:ABC-type transporter MlaC component
MFEFECFSGLHGIIFAVEGFSRTTLKKGFIMNKKLSIWTYLLICGLLAMLSSTVVFAEAQTAKALVTQLYKAYDWETKSDDASNRRTLLDESREVLAQYFDNKLTGLILKDRTCVKKTKEICHLDFSPIWASQDPSEHKKVSISNMNDVEMVRVEIHYEGQKPLKLTYHVTETKVGLRISDIEYSESSLLKILSD